MKVLHKKVSLTRRRRPVEIGVLRKVHRTQAPIHTPTHMRDRDGKRRREGGRVREKDKIERESEIKESHAGVR